MDHADSMEDPPRNRFQTLRASLDKTRKRINSRFIATSIVENRTPVPTKFLKGIGSKITIGVRNRDTSNPLSLG